MTPRVLACEADLFLPLSLLYSPLRSFFLLLGLMTGCSRGLALSHARTRAKVAVCETWAKLQERRQQQSFYHTSSRSFQHISSSGSCSCDRLSWPPPPVGHFRHLSTSAKGNLSRTSDRRNARPTPDPVTKQGDCLQLRSSNPLGRPAGGVAPLHRHFSRRYCSPGFSRRVGTTNTAGARDKEPLSAPPSYLLNSFSTTSKPLLLSCGSVDSPFRHSLRPQKRQFCSSSPVAMVAVKIDGTAIAKNIRERLGTEIAEKQKLNPRYKPTLKIIQGMSRLWPIRPCTIALVF